MIRKKKLKVVEKNEENEKFFADLQKDRESLEALNNILMYLIDRLESKKVLK